MELLVRKQGKWIGFGGGTADKKGLKACKRVKGEGRQ